MTWESKEDYQELKWRIDSILLCTSHHFESGRRERGGNVWGKKKREINCGMYENLIIKRICKNLMEKKLKMGEKSGGKEKN